MIYGDIMKISLERGAIVNLHEEMRKRNMSENDLMQYIVFEDECIKNSYTVQELCNLMEKNVRLGAYRQCLWERDMAISQLESIGVAFGEKADVQKVRYGEWRWNDDGCCRCSECRQKAPIVTQYQAEPFAAMTKFCPNCGARMDGGTENGN